MRLRFPFATALVTLVACASDDAPLDSTTDDDGTDTGAPSSSTTESTDEDGSSSEAGSDETPADSSTDDDGDSTGSSNAPVATPEEYFVAQLAELHVVAVDGVLSNDTHPDGAALSVIAFDSASTNGATVEVFEDGSFAFVPATDQWGEDAFGYTVADPAGNTATASVTVVVTPVHIPLESVEEGVGGFALDGEQSNDGSANVVGGGGDFDDDGTADVLVGAPTFGTDEGRGYVVFGGAAPRTTALAEVAAGTGGLAMTGPLSDQAATALDFAGDVDGDGIADILVGARYSNDFAGGAYIVFGRADIGSLQLASVGASEPGFRIEGSFEYEFVGTGGRAAGDVNGDGLADVVLVNDEGFGDVYPERAYVVFGKQDTDSVEIADVLAGVGGFAIVGEADSDGIGAAAAGDLDGDGLGDLVLGVPFSSASGDDSGRAYVVFGKEDTEPVELSEIASGVGGYAIDAESPEDWLGADLDAAGDVNGDGLADFVLGALGSPNGARAGRSYVVFGAGDRVPVTLADLVDGVGGFVIDGDEPGDGSAVVAGCGDVNADGLDDVIVGAATNSVTVPAYLVFGKADTDAVDLGDVADGIGGYVLDPPSGSGSYITVEGVGDVNEDGVGDLVMGIPDAIGLGRTYVVHGVRTQ